IVFMFYETEQPGLTNDHLVYHGDALAKSYTLWKKQKAASCRFRYLERGSPERWAATPMGLAPSQPNIELINTECYGGPKDFDKFPIYGKHAFGIIAELFSPKSRGTVTLRNADPTAIPVVDCNYLSDPLDAEVLAEACRFANEIITEGA
ncbi:hypothetical protein FOXB_16338, partial [Fusarium oxysporum f. sp. conglutinans Fo5176]